MSERTAIHQEMPRSEGAAPGALSEPGAQRCKGNGKCEHRLHLCTMVKKERLRSWLVELVREPAYYCRTCGRVAREPGYLCRPGLL